MVFLPDLIRDGKAGEAFLDRHFHFNIPFIVRFKKDPFFSVMAGKVAGSSAVGFGRPAGRAEKADQVFSFFQLLFLQAEDGTGSGKGEGESEIG